MKDQYSPNGDVWYDTGDPTIDGTLYPNAMQSDVYIGAVRPGDWVNITVNVMTAGTYQVGSTWASGNGNPGGEGGNGDMELQVSVNGTMMLDWKDVFPNYNTTADFHHWKPYPNMGTVTLQAGMQVIKLLSVNPHLNLDYIEFDLLGADGGIVSGGSGMAPGSGASSGAAGSGSSTSGSSASGVVASAGAGSGSLSTGSGTPSGGSGTTTPVGSGSTVASGAAAGSAGGGSGSVTSAGASVGGGSGANGSAPSTGGSSGTGAHANTSSGGSKGCAVGTPYDARWSGSASTLAMAAAAFLARRRRSRPRS
jgi:hypothetical protein